MREGLPLRVEDHWPEEDLDFDDDDVAEADLEDWSLEEDVRRLIDEL